MENFLRSTRQRLWKAWMAAQVEFQGQYSIERLQQLDTYISGLKTKRLVAICVLAPLPCLVLSLLKEVPPLQPPEAGTSANWVFFIRAVVVTSIINGTLLMQMGQGAPSLKLTARQVLFISLSASTVSMAVIFAICSATVFPLPFGVLVSAPPDVLVMAVCLVRIFGPRLRADPSIWSDLKKQLSIIHCQVSLTFIYPVYIYGFVSLTGLNQALFVAILPIIKLIAKNWISHALADQNDIKPQSVIFIGEVMNALYVSNALQSASSWSLTATIMAVDLVHFWVSMRDVMEVLNKVKVLMIKIPQDHPLAKENFLQLAVRMIAIDDTLSDRRQACDEIRLEETPIEKFTCFVDSSDHLKALDDERGATLVMPIQPSHEKNNIHMKKLIQGARVVPEESPKANCTTGVTTDIKTLFSESERVRFIEKSSRVLFITEYIVLAEYVEVVLPVVYSIYRAILFNMPNKAYYASLATLSRDDMMESLLNALAYSSLELISLIMSIIVLKRTLGFSSLCQLAYVLETHVRLIQVVLVNTLVYVTQLSLVHLGADFSFKFTWLRNT